MPDVDDIGCWTLPRLDAGQTLSQFAMDLKNLYDEVALVDDALIRVSSVNGQAIPVGPYDTPPVVIGEYVRVTDYLRGLAGFAADKVLWTDDGDMIRWDAEDCGA